MYKFNAVATSSQQIKITSNTYWSCKSDGNFKLSAYDGSGSTTIDVIIPEDVMTAEGSVYFSYGDERCIYPDLYIYYANNCLISTSPSYKVCGENKQKTIFFYYKEKGEVFNISVLCIGGWNVSTSSNGLQYLIGNNNITIISNGEDCSLFIKPRRFCNETSFVEVKLIKNPD